MTTDSPPKAWSVSERGLSPRPIHVFLDGEEQRHVTAYDTGEGWLDAFCTDPECPAYRQDRPGPHAVRKGNGRWVACRAPRAFGVVTVEFR